MILEGIVTTLNDDGSINISPMGPEVDLAFRRMVLKPFRTSTTYRNLKRTRQGVFHVTDDVELLARAAVGTVDPLPALCKISAADVPVLADACRWYALRVESLDDSQERVHIAAVVVAEARIRDFFGFNRAKHAVVEAAILATRVHLLQPEQIAAEFDRLRLLVDKTGGPQEHRAFEFLNQFVSTRRSQAAK